MRGEAEVRRLETQRRVVRHHARGSRESLTECRTDDAIVGFGRIETVLDEKMALNSVDLDVDRGTLAHGGRRSQRTPCLQANFLELPQGRSGSATHVVGTTLSPSNSSITVRGTTMSQPGYACRQFESAIRTDVSSTTRVAAGASALVSDRRRELALRVLFVDSIRTFSATESPLCRVGQLRRDAPARAGETPASLVCRRVVLRWWIGREKVVALVDPR